MPATELRAGLAAPVRRDGASGAAADYDVTTAHGIDAVVATLAGLLREDVSATVFQTCDWLETLMEDVAPAMGADPRLVVVREKDSGALVVALPLLVRRQRGLRVAEIADLGLSDYCAPLIGPAAPAEPAATARMMRTLLAALVDIDRLRIDKMPREVEGRCNPLVLSASVAASKFNGNQLSVDSSVEAFLARRGKKYRKEAERSRRRLEDFGVVDISRARSTADIISVYETLEKWQEARHREAGHDYWLDRPEVSKFYLDLLLRNAETGSAAIYLLRVGETPVAALLGVVRNGGFTLLRIADAAGEWRHTSPGRMIVLGAMEELVARDIRVFDMGIGDYPFKRWIGCEAYPLFEVDIAVTPAAAPFVVAAKLKRRLRQNEHVKRAVEWVKARRRPAAPASPPAATEQPAD